MERSYIFDLDRTLYPHDSEIYNRVFEVITEVIGHHTGLTPLEIKAKMAEAHAQRKDPYLSLAEEYDFNISEVLIYPRHLDYGVLKPCVETRRLIHNLPAHKKVVYTDSTAEHAELVLSQLHLRDLFDAVYDIHFSGLQAKALRPCFNHVLEDMGTTGAQCTMIEDTPDNLKVAKAMGMRTVLLSPVLIDQPDHVDEIASDLPTWLRIESERVQ